MTDRRSTFFARHSRAIVVLVGLAFPFVVYGSIVAMQSNHNDIQEWLPVSFEETQEYNRFQRQFASDTFVLASWEGCTLDDSRLPRFAAALEPTPERKRAGTDYFSKVITGRSVLNQLTTPPTSLAWKPAVERLIGSLIGPDRNQTCAVLTVSPYGKQHFREMLDDVERVAADCEIPPDTLHMAGPPVDNVAIDRVSESLRQELMVLSGVLGLALAWWYLRDVRLTTMVFIAGLYTATLCLAILAFTGGIMNSVLFTMPAVVYTAGLSAAIHVVNYYRYARAEGGLAGAADRGLRAAWLPCTLSAGTTSLGLISLCTSAIVPIKTFGLYTSIGVMSAVGLVFLFLPAALELWPPQQSDALGTDVDDSPRNLRHRRHMRRLGVLVIARPLWVWAVFMILLVVCGAGLHRVKTTVNLMSLFSPQAKVIASYRWLEAKLGKMAPMEVVLRLDESTCKLTLVERLELVARMQTAIEKISDEVGRTMSAVTFVPDLAPKKRGGLGGVFLRGSTWAMTLNKRLKEHQSELISGDYVADDAQTHEQLWRISVRVAALADVDYGEFIHELRRHVDPIIEAERDKGVVGIEGVTYTGLVPVIYKAERELLNGLIDSFFWAFVMMAAMMTIVFRDLRRPVHDAAECLADRGRVRADGLGPDRPGYRHDDDRQRGDGRLRGRYGPLCQLVSPGDAAGAGSAAGGGPGLRKFGRRDLSEHRDRGLGAGDFFAQRVHAHPALRLLDEHPAVLRAGGRPGAFAGDAFRPDRQVFHPQLPAAGGSPAPGRPPPGGSLAVVPFGRGGLQPCASANSAWMQICDQVSKRSASERTASIGRKPASRMSASRGRTSGRSTSNR